MVKYKYIMKEVICMSQNDWMDLGKNIGHTLKNAIDTLDFTELNRSIEKTVNSTTSMINNKSSSTPPPSSRRH